MLRRLFIYFTLAFIAAVLPVQAQDASNPPQTAGNSAAKSATADANYTIGAQDVLDISVWKEPGVSRTVPVRPDGKISLPLLDDVQAAGLTPMQLSDLLTAKLKKYLANPQVTVIVTQINSQRVYVIGQVARQGAYPLLPGMTILQALSSAGGFSQFANQKKIELLRTTGGKLVKYRFNYKEAIEGVNPEQNMTLKVGDQIIVP